MDIPFWGLLGSGRDTPTRVFLKKRLQSIENKGREGEFWRKEAAGD
jgi:hypothetical protein